MESFERCVHMYKIWLKIFHFHSYIFQPRDSTNIFYLFSFNCDKYSEVLSNISYEKKNLSPMYENKSNTYTDSRFELNEKKRKT